MMAPLPHDAAAPPTGVSPQAWQRLKPHVRGFLHGVLRKQRPVMQHMPIEMAREAYALGSSVLEPEPPELACVQDLPIPRRDGSPMRARLYATQPAGPGAAAATPAAAPSHAGAALLPVLLYFHGGGFVVGSIDTHDAVCRRLCQISGCAVVSLDYRLAPEHKFPAAFDDCWDGLHWLAQHAATWGLDASRLAVGGDSAGGTLAAACAVRAAQQGLPLRLQLLFYPGMQAEPLTPSRTLYAQGFLLSEAQIQWMFHTCVRDAADFADWRFAPLHADDVSHVAPLWLGLAECDPIVDDSLLWADKLRAAGVPVEVELYHGVIHEFIKLGRAMPEAQQALQDAAQALRRALFD